ncbi:hypothetical protein D9757_001935 [Collybiopsis confluens]|uniref:Uncharacterized protein n=1 Tax=Collybiopsis confluens TaxID=2823264 RepID=A0A8H5HXL8_9AGAR|nr:hypothetical protein D9757_001935 [Collybiopsis confluens]
MSTLAVNVANSIATITFNRPKSYNAITTEDYEAFADALRAIDKRDDVLVTVWQATGKWFCAGTDVKDRIPLEGDTLRQQFLKRIAHTTTDCGQALYSHSKVLVAALNGPVMGKKLHLVSYMVFYDVAVCMIFDSRAIFKHFWGILTSYSPFQRRGSPFHLLFWESIIAEGGSSVSFINRMGPARANEVLLWGKKKTAQELLACNFINDIFPSESTEEFHAAVRSHLLRQLDGLDPAAVLSVKKLLRAGLNEKNDPNAVNLRESYAQAERFESGIPERQFSRIARKEIKHKL